MSDHVYHFKHGWIPIDSYAANIKLQRSSASKLAGHSGGMEVDPKLTTLVNLREMGAHTKYDALLKRHQAEHGKTSSAEQIAASVHGPGGRQGGHPEAHPVAATSTAEKIAAQVTGKPSGHIAEAMDRGKLPDTMRAPMAEALSHQAKYPGLNERLTAIRVTSSRDRVDGRYEARQLHVSPDLFEPDGKFATDSRARRAAENARGGNVGTARIKAVESGHVSDADALVAHEMGHAVEEAIGDSGRLEAMTAMARAAELPEPTPVMRHFNDGGPDVLDHGATLGKWVKSKPVKQFLTTQLSQYGASNALEASAEMWSVYSLDGHQAPSWVRAFGDTAAGAMARRAAMR